MSIAVGQTAPDFYAMNQDKKEVKLSDFAGEKERRTRMVPAGLEPDVHQRACLHRQRDEGVRNAWNAEVLGVSVDTCGRTRLMQRKMGIKYSLLADFHPREAASERFGVYLADKGLRAGRCNRE